MGEGGFGGGTVGPCKPNIMEVVTWSLPNADTTHVQLMVGGEDAKSTAKAKPNAGTLYTFAQCLDKQVLDTNNIFDNTIIWQDECLGQGRQVPLYLRMPQQRKVSYLYALPSRWRGIAIPNMTLLCAVQWQQTMF